MTFTIILAVLAAAVLYGISIYNRLVKNKNMVEEGWSGIDVQLKRRSNLIPNLLNSVKGYMKHEKDLLTEVTRLRANAEEAQGKSPAERSGAEAALSTGLIKLFAVMENYPDLKANQNVLDFQNSLETLENEIQMSRRYYNGAVRNLNVLIESFPSNLIANAFKFLKAEFFEIADDADRAVPKVEF